LDRGHESRNNVVTLTARPDTDPIEPDQPCRSFKRGEARRWTTSRRIMRS
jgi:hypothetical protein